jgi:ribonuclease-3
MGKVIIMDFLEKYDIHIVNKDLLMQALTHSSYTNEHKDEGVKSLHYERLEFLGDAVLQLLMSDYLFNHMHIKEGEMSKLRASYVCAEACRHYADRIGYIPYIRVGKGQIKDINDTIIADIFESILGCIYLDQGYSKAKSLFDQVVIPYVESDEKFIVDYKSKLQELVQTEKKSLEYKVVNETGLSNDKTFEVIVSVDGIIYGKGTGKSKKMAEQNAAKDAYSKQAKI